MLDETREHVVAVLGLDTVIDLRFLRRGKAEERGLGSARRSVQEDIDHGGLQSGCHALDAVLDSEWRAVSAFDVLSQRNVKHQPADARAPMPIVSYITPAAHMLNTLGVAMQLLVLPYSWRHVGVGMFAGTLGLDAWSVEELKNSRAQQLPSFEVALLRAYLGIWGKWCNGCAL